MSLFCFVALLLVSGEKTMYMKVTWLVMSLFFLVLLIISQFIRTKPNNLFPTAVIDVASAIKWTYDHAEIFGGDRENMSLAGHSAGAHLMTDVYASPKYWQLTGVPRSCIKCIVAISGVYSAKCMRNDFMFRTIGQLVFDNETDDNHEWDNYFPCEIIQKNSHIPWPRLLLLTAQFDFKLREHASEIYDVLYASGQCVDLEWITIQKVTHFSITCFWSYQHRNISNYVSDFISRSLSCSGKDT